MIDFNPASSVKGPRLVVTEGKTPVLSGEDAALLLDSIDTSKIAGLRDRALIGCTLYGFARIGEVLKLDTDHVFDNKRTLWLQLHEKGGKQHKMPAHHRLAVFLDEYMHAADVVPSIAHFQACHHSPLQMPRNHNGGRVLVAFKESPNKKGSRNRIVNPLLIQLFTGVPKVGLEPT